MQSAGQPPKIFEKTASSTTAQQDSECEVTPIPVPKKAWRSSSRRYLLSGLCSALLLLVLGGWAIQQGIVNIASSLSVFGAFIPRSNPIRKEAAREPIVEDGLTRLRSAPNSVASTAAREPLVVSVAKDGRVFVSWDSRAIMDLDDLALRLQAIAKSRGGFDKTIFVRGGDAAEFSTVARVMARIKDAGFRKLSLVTDVQNSPRLVQPAPEGRDDRSTASQTAMLVGKLTSAVGACMRADSGAMMQSQYVPVVEFELARDGGLVGEPRLVNPESSPEAIQAGANAIRAIKACAPYTLPPELYDHWQVARLRFDPKVFR